MNFRCGHQLIDLSTPKVMGIINCTPDSFFGDSRAETLSTAIKIAENMVQQGVDILDLGGMSTRPGSKEVDLDEEKKRVLPVLTEIKKRFPKQLVSIDTYRAKIAELSVEQGADIVNDISAGNLDDMMFDCISDLGVPYVLMHMKGVPRNMQENPSYENLIPELNQFFAQKIQALLKRNVHDLILDPGFGFGKTIDDNFRLIKGLGNIGFGDFPVLVGISRKSMIYKTLEVQAKDALNGTTALHVLALQNGASILRVHDVPEAREAITLYQKYKHVANI